MIFCSFFVIGISGLIDNQSTNLIGKYFGLVISANGGAYFLIVGLLIVIGKLKPYITADSQFELAKNFLITFLVCLPFWLALVIEFILGDYLIYKKILLIGFISYFLYKAFASYRCIKRHDL